MSTERYVADIIGSAIEHSRVRAAGDLERQLDVMAAQIPAETTPEQMEAALEEALAAVRPRRGWHA